MVHQLGDLPLGIGAESGIDILLPQQVAQAAVHRHHTAELARARLAGAGQVPFPELEILFFKRLGKKVREPPQQVEGQVRAERFHRLVHDAGRHALQEIRIAHVERFEIRCVHSCEIGVPVEVHQLRQFRPLHHVITLEWVAHADAVGRIPRQNGLHVQYHLGVSLGRFGRFARQLQHLRDMFHVALTDFHRLRIGLQIVIAVGKRKSALLNVGDGAVRVLVVRL